jgi:hypothetical protein
MDRTDLRRLTLSVLSWIATPIALYYTASWLLEHLDPLKQRNDVARKQSANAIKRLQKSVKDAHIRLKDITEHETIIMSEVITPDELNVKFQGILHRAHDFCLTPIFFASNTMLMLAQTSEALRTSSPVSKRL